MIRRTITLVASALIATLALVSSAGATEEACTQTPRTKCFGVESVQASLSTTEAGAHPDLTFSFGLKIDPESTENSSGLRDSYAIARNVRVELPPGLIGDPGVLGVAQQCTAVELSHEHCPNGSQIGISEVVAYATGTLLEPVYMMVPPGGNDVVARIGFVVAGIPTYADATVRSESDYGLDFEIVNIPTIAHAVSAETTTWGVPADPIHDTERCTPNEASKGCTKSEPRPPGNRELPFLTNPTRCGVPLEMRVGASSWLEPEFDPEDFKSASFPQITECNRLPFGPSLVLEPTSHRAGAPTGFEAVEVLPAAKGVKVLEPSQARDFHVTLPEGVTINPASADGLGVCSEEQVHFGKRVAAECPENAKLAEFEAEIPALPKRLKGALYLREPEPGNLYRFWVVADDLGAHVKLEGQLEVDEQTGQIETVIEELPQAPMREVNVTLKSGLRAPLANPETCGTFDGHYSFTPWSGGTPVSGNVPVRIDEGCDTGGFSPKLNAGTANPVGGARTQFVFTLTREDGEQNPASLDITLPKGLTASLAGIPRCDGTEAQSGQCPAASRIGRVIAAAGAGPKPLWVPQPGKRPTAVYLGGPYKGAPLSAIAVVPAQAGPFDLGDQVVRSAIYLDPDTAQGTVRSDPLPQIIEGVPIRYRTVQVLLDRAGGFTINPTSCQPKSIEAAVTSTQGAVAHPSSPFTATNCGNLGFKPNLGLRLFGGTHRGAHPRLRTTLKMPAGGANIGAFSVALPHAEFLDQAHIKTVCTRVQFRVHQCPPGSVYGQVKATTPILDEPLEGPLYLRSSDHPLPDMVAVLKGPPSLPVEVNAVGRIDSVNGGIRATFESVPDAPVARIVASFPGGKKGLMVNSTDLCEGTHRVTATFAAQNGKQKTLRPVLQAKCKKARRRPKAGSR
jgi:hypothetical protein